MWRKGQTMSDLIKREDAIDAVTAYLDLCCLTEARFHKDGKDYNRIIAEELLENVLTVEPKIDKDALIRLIQGAVEGGEDCRRLMEMVDRPQGEWITEEKDSIYGKKIRLKCSECGDTFDVSEKAFPYERFCRYCGADMRKGADDA